MCAHRFDGEVITAARQLAILMESPCLRVTFLIAESSCAILSSRSFLQSLILLFTIIITGKK